MFYQYRLPVHRLRQGWRAVGVAAVGIACILSLSSCFVPNASQSARDSLRANVENFAKRLPDAVNAEAGKETAMKDISGYELALFHPEQTTQWPNGGGSSALPQVYELRAGEPGLSMDIIFTGQGQSGGGWTFESAMFFLCATVTLEGQETRLKDTDCPTKAVAALPPDTEVHLSDVGIRPS